MKTQLILLICLLQSLVGLTQGFDHIIDQDEDWYTDPTLTGSVWIQRGAKLTIHTGVTVAMPYASFIFVDVDAELHAEGATFTADDQYWLGIDCYGTNSIYSIASSSDKNLPQPKVFIQDCYISGMSAGISSNSSFFNYGSASPNSTGGGILRISGTVFHNNPMSGMRGIINFYHNARVNGQNPVADQGFVTKCTFNDIVTKGILIHTCINVQIRGCTFIGNPSISQDPYFSGIYVNDASCKIEQAVTPYPYSATPCNFYSLAYGVYVTKDFTFAMSSIIRDANFTECMNAVHVVGNDNIQIHSNNIYLTPSASYVKAGIYLDGCTGFHVEGNNISRDASSQNETYLTYGIVVKNSEINQNVIYRNNFVNCYYGIAAFDANRNGNIGIGDESGLKFQCNSFESFDDAYYMAALTQSPLDPFHGVSALQAGAIANEPTSPCYNAMVDRQLAMNSENDFYNQHGLSGTMDILYIIPGGINGPDIYDLKYKTSTIENLYSSIYTTSTPHCGSKLPCQGINCPNPPMYPMVIEDEFMEYSDAKDELFSLLNGGDHDGLMNQVVNVDAQTLLYVYYLLMNSSPSFDILALACSNDLFPNYMVRDILVENSYGIKSQSVRNALAIRNDPLTQPQMDQIDAAAQTLSDIETLMLEINHMEQEYYFLINASLNYYFGKDTIDLDTVKLYLTAMNDFYASTRLIMIALNERDLDGAQQLYESLSSYNVSQNTLVSYSILYEQILLPVFRDLDGDFSLMDEEFEEDLLQVMDYNTYSSSIAKSLLIHWFEHEFEPVYLTVPDNNRKSNPKNIPETSPDKSWLFPNPSCSIITINNQIKATDLNILDLQGRLIANYSLDEKTMNIDISGLTNGLYIIQLFRNDIMVETTKLIKY